MKALLKKLNKINIKIDLVDEKLDIQAPKGVMTEDLLNEIKLYKNDLIAFINLNKAKKEKHLFIPRVPLQTNYVLSSSQRRLWLISQFEGGNAAYNMSSVFELKGDVSISSLQNTFESLIERHESLRTLFKEDETGQVRQFILTAEDSKFQLQFEDVSEEDNNEEIIKRIILEDTSYTFDLSTDSLLRAKLIKTSQDTYVFVCVMHHIISDGQSAEVMTNELFTLYDSFVKGNSNPLLALHIQYKDYATWQQDLLKKKDIESHKSYWLQQFGDELPILDLPTYQTRPAIKTYNGKSLTTVYGENLFKDFNDLCQSQGSTLFIGLLAVSKILLYRYTNQTDIVIGSPIAGREHADLQNQIGFYVNTLALRTQFEGKDTFNEVLANVREVTLGAFKHQVYPFDELVVELATKRDLSRNPLFDVMVTFQNSDSLKTNVQIFDAIEVKEFRLEEEVLSKFDMDFAYATTDKGLGLTLTYNTDIYSEEFTKRIVNHLETLLRDIVMRPNVSLSSLNYITEAENYRLLVEFNNTEVSHPTNKTIIDLFEAQVDETPENIAVVFEEKSLSYRELNEKANQLAYYLRENYSIKPDDLLGIKLERSEMMIIAILGILKSGAAYVPIDPNYPQERVAYIEKDSNSKIIIDKAVLQNFEEHQESLSKANINKINQSSDLAYVIYTSGTTGNPKGVMVENRNAVELINWSKQEFKASKFDIAYAVTSYCFDLSIYEIFYTLSTGKKIRLLKNAFDIEKYLREDRNVLINTVPSVVRKLLDDNIPLGNVCNINIAGEVLPVDIISKLPLDKIEVRNLYGPSEDTTYSTFYLLNKDKKYLNIPIGKPIFNTQVYILDDALQPLPMGVTGKLYVSGLGLARGYFNKPELTSEKFILNPFIDGKRMYETGDLARWLPDGNIEFLGRKDQQVKIRGFRIELEEIEKTLLEYSEDLEQVVVEVQEVNYEKSLVAYFVASIEIDKEKIRIFLQEKLPFYMIPGFFVALENLPLTPNGKINRKALPTITNEDLIRKEFLAPKTPFEKHLAEIWQEVLRVDIVGLNDDFFELGGNSLLFVKIYEKFKSKYKSNINLTKFYTSTTIELQARTIDFDVISNNISEKKVENKLPGNLNFFWEKAKDSANAKNVSFGIATTFKIDFKKINHAFNNLCERHRILNSNVIEENENVFFKVSDKQINLILEKNLHYDDVLKKCSEVHRRKFNFNNESLIKGYMFEIDKGKTILFFSVPHLIFDGLSLAIFWKDLFDAYSSHSEIEVLNNQFIESAFNRYNFSLTDNKDSEYWKKLFDKKIEPVNIHNEIINVTENKSLELSFSFNPNLYDKLNILCKELKISINTFILSAIALLIKEKNNQKPFALCFDHHSRTEETIDQIGFWVQNLFIEINENDFTINEFFRTVNKKINDSMEHSNVDILSVATQKFGNDFEQRLNDLKRVRFNYYDESVMNINLSNIDYEHIYYNNTFFIPAYLHFFVVKTESAIEMNIMANNKYFIEENLQDIKKIFNKICESVIFNDVHQKSENIFKLIN